MSKVARLLEAAALKPLHRFSKKAKDPKPASARKRQKFSDALENARQAMDPQSRMQVDSLPPDFDGSLFLTDDGMAGYAVTRNGELVNAFNHPDNPNRGAMDAILTSARAEGASHLHGFENLAESYIRRGARETNRYPWDPREAASLTEWDPTSMGTPDYVRMDIGGVLDERRATQHAQVAQQPLERRTPSAISREAAGKPPLGQVPEPFIAQYGTPENRARILEYVQRGMERGADRWYHTGGIRDKFVDVLGPEQGNAAFEQFMALNAATSPQTEVAQNIRRASIPYQSARQGGSLDVPYEGFPEGYRSRFHKSHAPALKRLQEEGVLGDPSQQMKIMSYFENLKGNLDPVTVDTHNYRIWTGREADNLGAAEYRALEMLQREMAAEMGISPAEFQSALWVGAEDITGVANPQNFTAAMNQRVAATARELGVPESEAFALFARGDTRLYSHPGATLGGAGLVGAGVLASPDEAEAGPIGTGGRAAGGAGRRGARGARGTNQHSGFGAAEEFVTKSQNDFGRWKRFGEGPEDALNKLSESMERIGNMRRHGRISEKQATAAFDELFPLYQEIQTSLGRTNVSRVGEVDIPMAPERMGAGHPTSPDIAAAQQPLAMDTSSGNLMGGTPESPGAELAPYRLHRELTPDEIANQGYWDSVEAVMRQDPHAAIRYHPPPDTVNDPFLRFQPQKATEWQQFTPEQVAYENQLRQMGSDPAFNPDNPAMLRRQALAETSPTDVPEGTGLWTGGRKQAYAGAAAPLATGGGEGALDERSQNALNVPEGFAEKVQELLDHASRTGAAASGFFEGLGPAFDAVVPYKWEGLSPGEKALQAASLLLPGRSYTRTRDELERAREPSIMWDADGRAPGERPLSAMERIGGAGQVVADVGRDLAGMLDGSYRAIGAAVAPVLDREVLGRMNQGLQHLGLAPAFNEPRPLPDVDDLGDIIRDARERWNPERSTMSRAEEAMMRYFEQRPELLDLFDSSGELARELQGWADRGGPVPAVFARTFFEGLSWVL